MRLQLALNVSDLDKAIDFYTRISASSPPRPSPATPTSPSPTRPLKLVLFEGQGEAGTINHLGVETETAAEVVAAEARLTEAGLETTGVDDTQCCYAAKTETWLTGPDDARWEWYVKTGDSDQFQRTSSSTPPGRNLLLGLIYLAVGCRGPGSIETDLLGLALG